MRTIRLASWGLVGLAIVAIGLFFLFERPGGNGRGGNEVLRTATTGTAAIRADFSLVDHTGKRVTADDYKGRWLLVYFGFTYCPDICITSLNTMHDVMEKLGDTADRVQPMMISVDPERDTPEVMARYVNAFDKRIVGLTGTDDEIRHAARSFRAYYARRENREAPERYLVDHSGYLYLMAPDGSYRTVYSHSEPASKIAPDILRFIEKEKDA